MDLRVFGVDWQNDFVKPAPVGALAVPGAEDDAARCAEMIRKLGDKVTDFHFTMDSHRLVDIAHPVWWVDAKNNHPDPFTLISAQDIADGKWFAANPAARTRSVDYVNMLDSNGRYMLCIWPPHCLIGTSGHNIVPVIMDALMEWEARNHGLVDYVTKGSNPWTEHYSAVKADVPDPKDAGTSLNRRLIQTLGEADVIALTGEALSHCVANTVRDIADNFGEENIKNMYLISDCSSPVDGFDDLADAFVNDMAARGMNILDSKQFVDFIYSS